jgi:hypothetical protein
MSETHTISTDAQWAHQVVRRFAGFVPVNLRLLLLPLLLYTVVTVARGGVTRFVHHLYTPNMQQGSSSEVLHVVRPRGPKLTSPGFGVAAAFYGVELSAYRRHM